LDRLGVNSKLPATILDERKTYNRQEGRPDKTGLAKVAVQCSADKFVVNQSLVLRINICGENRHLRQARKRWALLIDSSKNF